MMYRSYLKSFFSNLLLSIYSLYNNANKVVSRGINTVSLNTVGIEVHFKTLPPRKEPIRLPTALHPK